MAKVRTDYRHLSISDKRIISEKIMDLGNIAVGALFFSQLLSNNKFNLLLGLTGVAFLFFCYYWAIISLKKSR